jgi:hypothetical protein
MTDLKDIFAESQAAPPAPAVVRATDLTGVIVLKHDELYLLTDAFGDIHYDRHGLGLYGGDTRFLLRFEGRDTSLSVEVMRRGGDIDVVVRL